MKTFTTLLKKLNRFILKEAQPSSSLTVWDIENNALLVFDNESDVRAWLQNYS